MDLAVGEGNSLGTFLPSIRLGIPRFVVNAAAILDWYLHRGTQAKQTRPKVQRMNSECLEGQ